MTERGFSLLEAAIALAIVGLAAIGALASFGAQLATAGRAHHYLEAGALADEMLARLRLLGKDELDPLADSLRDGNFDDPFSEYRWTATARALLDNQGLYEVAVAVHWSDGVFTETTRVYRPLESGGAR